MIYALDGRAPQVAGDVYIAPGASVIGDVHIAAGASIWFGAILRGDVDRLTIGRGTNIQDNSVLHADPGTPLVVGAGVTVGHAVTLHGCHVGDESLIGIGAIVMNRVRIGAHCIVGAGALVTEGKEYPDGVLIVGSPARVIRELTAAEIAGLAESARRYSERAQLYRRALRPA
ncbi:MAG: gamma carbonic anhydrase family protein [Gammaproteobacteria bacterium]|nr:gamma carbonic anhydrase family protein [Gammaproteobacteria bacterium]QOJ31095.1 MAG: gamma carbonic anhydrase family protein [Gammaproteobacteria bacterium]